MKKMMKKIAVPVLSVAMLLGTIAAPAFANGVQTYGAKCPECTQGEILFRTFDSEGIAVDKVSCKKDPTQYDLVIDYIQYNSWVCNYCNYGDVRDIPKTRIECPHN